MSDKLTWAEERRLYEEALDRSIERIMTAAPHCSVHGSPFVAGVGYGGPEGKFYPAKQGGECPLCMWAMIGFRKRNGLEKP
jgi:hypothetical protein